MRWVEQLLLMVEDENGRRSEDEDAPGLGFSIIKATEAQRLRVAIERLTGQKIPDEAKDFALAHLYKGYKPDKGYTLISEAVEILEALPRNSSQSGSGCNSETLCSSLPLHGRAAA